MRHAVPRFARLGILDRESDVLRDGDEHVELVVVRAPAATPARLPTSRRAASRPTPSTEPGGRRRDARRRVAGVGSTGGVKVGPDSLQSCSPARIDVRAAAEEAVVEQRPVILPRPRAAHEGLARLLATAHGRHAEVVHAGR